MVTLVTGVAGFIGSHVCNMLLNQGKTVIGMDNLNDYYDIDLKESRLNSLKNHENKDNFLFHKVNIADKKSVDSLADCYRSEITHVIHLAAQAGVRYSLDNPFAYIESNISGHLVILEMCRTLPNLKHFVYASSSSVYGGNRELPYSVNDNTDSPVSLYAATKKSDELMSHSYTELFNIPSTGLRFFTVYGIFGRPDMAYFIFTKAILEGKPIHVFNNGKMKRDFTYIDDIVNGVISCTYNTEKKSTHKIYNLGNNKPVPLMNMISVLEKTIGKKAEIIMKGMQQGDVIETFADITDSRKDFGYNPVTTIEEGLPRFVEWYKNYYLK